MAANSKHREVRQKPGVLRARRGGGRGNPGRGLRAPPPPAHHATAHVPRWQGEAGRAARRCTLGARSGTHTRMDTPHRPRDPDLSLPNRAPGDRPRGQAAQLFVAASGRSSGLSSSSGVSAPTHIHCLAASDLCSRAQAQAQLHLHPGIKGREREGMVSPRLWGGPLQSHFVPSALHAFPSCAALNPCLRTLPPFPRLCNRNDAEGLSEDLMRANEQAENSSW